MPCGGGRGPAVSRGDKRGDADPSGRWSEASRVIAVAASDITAPWAVAVAGKWPSPLAGRRQLGGAPARY